jgi:hypothetical protein
MINWFFHLRPYLTFVRIISLASHGSQRLYLYSNHGNLCDVTGNHKIWGVTHSHTDLLTRRVLYIWRSACGAPRTLPTR